MEPAALRPKHPLSVLRREIPTSFPTTRGLHGSTGRAARPLAGRRQRAERAGRLSGLPHVDAAARAAPGLPEQRLCALPWGGGHRPLGCGRTELTLSVGLQETVKGPLAGRRRKCSANCKTLMEHGEAVISQQGTIIIIATNLVTKASWGYRRAFIHLSAPQNYLHLDFPFPAFMEQLLGTEGKAGSWFSRQEEERRAREQRRACSAISGVVQGEGSLPRCAASSLSFKFWDLGRGRQTNPVASVWLRPESRLHGAGRVGETGALRLTSTPSSIFWLLSLNTWAQHRWLFSASRIIGCWCVKQEKR